MAILPYLVLTFFEGESVLIAAGDIKNYEPYIAMGVLAAGFTIRIIRHLMRRENGANDT